MIHALVATFFMMLCIVVGAWALERAWPAQRPWGARVAAFRSELRVALVIGGVLVVGWLLMH